MERLGVVKMKMDQDQMKAVKMRVGELAQLLYVLNKLLFGIQHLNRVQSVLKKNHIMINRP